MRLKSSCSYFKRKRESWAANAYDTENLLNIDTRVNDLSQFEHSVFPKHASNLLQKNRFNSKSILDVESKTRLSSRERSLSSKRK